MNVIMVNKLWQTDIKQYILRLKFPKEDDSKSIENVFTNIEDNVSLFMRTICPKFFDGFG